MYEESKEARGMTYTGLETYVQQAAFDQTLSRLYGAEGAEKAHSRCMEVMEEFYKTFDRPAEALFSAPGRTEIGGNHTDHQKGCVLAASVDLDILAAVAPTQSGIIRVLSQGYPMIEVDLRELDPKEEEINTSAALIRGVASCMSAMGCDLRERGLDVGRGADRAAQLSALRTQLRLARERGLPVVLHCVRAFEPLMRELAASEPRAVIFHGFIGSPEQARQALAKGYCLSFGERTFASPKTLAALRETPLSQLFLETDDSPVPIAEIYARAAEAKGVPEEELQRAILDNYKRIFTGGEYEGPGRTKGDK